MCIRDSTSPLDNGAHNWFASDYGNAGDALTETATGDWRLLMHLDPDGTLNVPNTVQAQTVLVDGGLTAAMVSGAEVYDNGKRVVTTSTISTYAVTTLTAGTDTSISASTGAVRVWNTSTLQSITSRGATTPTAISITSSTVSTSTTSGALIVTGGIGAQNAYLVNLNVSGKVTGTNAPKVSSSVTTSSLTWSSLTTDQVNVTGLTTSLTIASDSATSAPVDGQKVLFRIKAAGAGLTLSLSGTGTYPFRVIGAVIPGTLTNGNTLYIGCVYNAADTKWDVISAGQGA